MKEYYHIQLTNQYICPHVKSNAIYTYKKPMTIQSINQYICPPKLNKTLIYTYRSLWNEYSWMKD